MKSISRKSKTLYSKIKLNTTKQNKQNRKRLWYLSITKDKNKFSSLLNSYNIKTSMWGC